jgi:uncharacterized protein
LKIKIPKTKNKKLEKILEIVNDDAEIQTLWTHSNINAIDRLGLSDHGPTHIAITANAALKILKNLNAAGITPNMVKDHGMTYEDSEAVVFLASCLHDVGHIVHRKNHHTHSIPIASPILKRILARVYKPREATIIYGETLHAIISHTVEIKPLTIEAGVVRIADGCDMEKGRSRIPFSIGKKNIHSVSALAIKNLSITSSPEHPVVLNVEMVNSAGIFQVDSLLKEKITGSGLEKHVKVSATIKNEKEDRILDEYELKA